MICIKLFSGNFPLLTYIFPFFLQVFTFAFCLIGWNITKIWVCNQLYSDRSCYLCTACFLLSSLYVPCFLTSLQYTCPVTLRLDLNVQCICAQRSNHSKFIHNPSLICSAVHSHVSVESQWLFRITQILLFLQGLSTSFLLCDMWLIST